MTVNLPARSDIADAISGSEDPPAEIEDLLKKMVLSAFLEKDLVSWFNTASNYMLKNACTFSEAAGLTIP